VRIIKISVMEASFLLHSLIQILSFNWTF